MPKSIHALALIFVSFLMSACATSAMPFRPNPNGRFVDPDEFRGVFFAENSPVEGQSIGSSLSAAGNSMEAMNHDLRLIASFPKSEKFRVVGFTDNAECSSSRCDELSLRRAMLFQEWLIGQGVPADRFYPPRGYGDTRPIGDNQTGSGRAMNRRAHISYGSDLDN